MGGAVPFVPSGEQFEITRGEQHAVAVEVGGGVRVFEVAGHEVLESYPVDAMCDGARRHAADPVAQPPG